MTFGVKKIKQLLALASAFVVFAPIVAQPVALASADSVITNSDNKNRKVDLKQAVQATVKYSKEVPVLKVTITPTNDNYFVKGEKLNFKFDKKNVNLKNMQASAAKELPFKYHRDGNYKLVLEFTKTVKDGKFIQAYAIPTKEKGGKTAIKATFNDQKLKIKNNVIKSVDMFKTTVEESDSDSSSSDSSSSDSATGQSNATVDSDSSSTNSTVNSSQVTNDNSSSQATTNEQATVTTYDPNSGTYTTAPSSDFFNQSPVQTSTGADKNYSGSISQTTNYQSTNSVNNVTDNSSNYYQNGGQNTPADNSFNSQQVNTTQTSSVSSSSVNGARYQAPAASNRYQVNNAGSTKPVTSIRSTNKKTVAKSNPQKAKKVETGNATANKQTKPTANANKASQSVAQKPATSQPEEPTVNEDSNNQQDLNAANGSSTTGANNEATDSQASTSSNSSQVNNVSSITDVAQTTSDQTNTTTQTTNSQQTNSASVSETEATTALAA